VLEKENARTNVTPERPGCVWEKHGIGAAKSRCEESGATDHARARDLTNLFLTKIMRKIKNAKAGA